MYARPGSLTEAVAMLARHGGRILAGGTDLYPALVDKPPPGLLIDVSGLDELRGIAVSREAVRFGAATTWAEIAAADLPRAFDGLRAAAREVGSVQIQNAATIAGNLCNASPAADGVPPLLMLDAAIETLSPQGRRSLPLASFLTGYRQTRLGADEIVTAVTVPRGIDGPSAFLKLGARRYLVISIAMVAAVLQIGSAGQVTAARIAVGACSAVARRLRELEQDLVGRLAAADLACRAMPHHLAALDPIDDVRASAAYRRDAALTLVQRAITTCVAGLDGG